MALSRNLDITKQDLTAGAVDSALDKEIIGITGGIGSGKSVVSRILRLNGFPVYDCDSEARILMESSAMLKSDLCAILGNDIYTDSCHLDRKRMAGLIFSDHQLLMRVNKVVHSAVKDDFMRFARKVVSRKVFCESAILGSSGFADMCSRIWLVEAPEFVRINRVRHRNGMDEEEIRQRMHAQRDEFSLLPSDKIVCVPNDGMTELLPFILGLLHDVSKNITKHTERFQKT